MCGRCGLLILPDLKYASGQQCPNPIVPPKPHSQMSALLRHEMWHSSVQQVDNVLISDRHVWWYWWWIMHDPGYVPSKNVNTKAATWSAVFAVSPPPNNVLCRGNADSFLDWYYAAYNIRGMRGEGLIHITDALCTVYTPHQNIYTRLICPTGIKSILQRNIKIIDTTTA